MNKKIKKMLVIELGILFLVLMIYISLKLGLLNYMPACIINSVFHILCPSCGATRCIISFLNGNFVESFLYNPMFFVLIIYLIIFNIVYIINAFRKENILKFLYPKKIHLIVFLIVIVIFTICRNIG